MELGRPVLVEQRLVAVGACGFDDGGVAGEAVRIKGRALVPVSPRRDHSRGTAASGYSGWCSGGPKSGLVKSGLVNVGREPVVEPSLGLENSGPL